MDPTYLIEENKEVQEESEPNQEALEEMSQICKAILPIRTTLVELERLTKNIQIVYALETNRTFYLYLALYIMSFD